VAANWEGETPPPPKFYVNKALRLKTGTLKRIMIKAFSLYSGGNNRVPQKSCPLARYQNSPVSLG
jgi:hypothetical protein